jgi:hypothetical protein
MRRVLAAAAVAAAIAGCASGTAAARPAWCRQAEHLNQTLAEPQRVQDAILLMTADSLPGDPAGFRALLAEQKRASGTSLAVRKGTAAAVILRRDCGY